MKNIEKRLRALEARMISDRVVLHFADGSTGEIYGPGDFLPGLLAAALGGGKANPAQAAQLDLIRQAVSADEPGGGRLVELIKSMLDSPREGPDTALPELRAATADRSPQQR